VKLTRDSLARPWRTAWLWLGLLMLALGSMPLWIEMPEPQASEGALRISQALFIRHDGEGQRIDRPRVVSLPHRWKAPVGADGVPAGVGDYEISLNLDAVPAQPLYIFVPVVTQSVGIIYGNWTEERSAQQIGQTSGLTSMGRLPTLHPGLNTLHLRVKTMGVMPGYLSEVYIGPLQAFHAAYRFQVFVLEHLRLMVFAMQVLLAILIVAAFAYYPKDPFFGWMAVYMWVSLLSYAGMFTSVFPDMPAVLP
jgi:hypothetical protein